MSNLTTTCTDACPDLRSRNVIISDTLAGVGEGELANYLLHAICLGGTADFDFNGRSFSFGAGDLIIVRKGCMIENLRCSEDFEVKVIYVHQAFVEQCTPMTNYGMKGAVALFLNPVMRLTECQFEICVQDFRSVEYRHNTTCFNFYEEGLRCAVQLMILDFFNFHSRLTDELHIPSQHAIIMAGFFDLLEKGNYVANREVSFYASELYISAKYLSEICKKLSGQTANFWINRYTALGILRMLKDKSLSIVQISDRLNFSSPAYFTRYVKKYLGKAPSEFRE